MDFPRRTLLLAALLLAAGPFLRAQTAADPSGHWEGTVEGPQGVNNIEIDLTKSGKGQLAGTFTNQVRNIQGLPLAKVVLEGTSIHFSAREDSMFKGVLSADGQSISGEFIGTDPTGTEFALPFKLTRTGDARMAPSAKHARISKELAGTWNGTLDVEAEQLRFVLSLANQPDGTGAGSLVSLDRGALKVPMTALTQSASQVRLEFKSVNASYAGTLNAAATEMVGIYTQGELVVPLTFRRAAAGATRQ